MEVVGSRVKCHGRAGGTTGHCVRARRDESPRRLHDPLTRSRNHSTTLSPTDTGQQSGSIRHFIFSHEDQSKPEQIDSSASATTAYKKNNYVICTYLHTLNEEGILMPTRDTFLGKRLNRFHISNY